MQKSLRSTWRSLGSTLQQRRVQPVGLSIQWRTLADKPSSFPAKTPHNKDAAADPQSSASEKLGLEDKTGDDHPAKQPDNQVEPEQKTGFEGTDSVKGGKGGLHNRTDK